MFLSVKNKNSKIIRRNISITDELYSEAKKFAPKRQFSRFVSEAIQEKIKREKSFSILNAPKMPLKINDPVHYIRKRRESDDRTL